MKFNSKLLRSDMIAKRKIERNITMDEAAKEIGVAKCTISRMENQNSIDIETLCKFCEWLQTNPSRYFLPITDDKTLNKH